MTTYRNILKAAAIAVLFGLFVMMPQRTLGAAPAEQPNIVFLMTDDQRWDMLGCYAQTVGRDDVVTPNIDKLAAEGVVFDNAYYAVAICQPSRATILTGRYFSDHQVGFTPPYNRALSPEEFARTYPAVFKKAGYRTGFIGKFNVRVKPKYETIKEHFDFFQGLGAMMGPGGPILIPENDATLKYIVREDRDPTERCLIKGDSAIHFLETQPEGQPFCLSVSFDAVKNDRDHDMYGPHVKLFEGKDMWVPENYVEGDNEKLPQVLKDHARGVYLHRARTATMEQYQDVARRFAVQGYTVDQQVKRVLEKLEEMGVADNTIIVYTSDNGRFHGSHGLFDKAILYDESMKQPLIVYDPRAPESLRGRRIDALVSSADVAPTLLGMAGLEIPSSMKGLDLVPLLEDRQDMSKWRDAVLIENFFIQELMGRSKIDKALLMEQVIADNRSYRSRGVRTERYKYFAYHEQDPVVEELYDMKRDPYEQNNLISNPEYAHIVADLRQRTEELTRSATQ